MPPNSGATPSGDVVVRLPDAKRISPIGARMGSGYPTGRPVRLFEPKKGAWSVATAAGFPGICDGPSVQLEAQAGNRALRRVQDPNANPTVDVAGAYP